MRKSGKTRQEKKKDMKRKKKERIEKERRENKEIHGVVDLTKLKNIVFKIYIYIKF